MLRRFFANHPNATDIIVASLYALSTLVWIVGPSTWAVAVLPALIWVLAVLGRRRYPVAAVVVSSVTTFIAFAITEQGDIVAPLLIVYAGAVYRAPWLAWAGFGSHTVATLLGMAVGVSAGTSTATSQGPVWLVWLAVIPYATLLLIAVLIGVNVGNRRRYLMALVDRAERLARERDQQALLAAAAERARIAREMHDVVSHGLTVVIALSEGAAATVERDPAAAADLMRRTAAGGREALAEMRRMLGVLGSDGGTAPQPGLGDLDAVVRTARDAGLAVDYRVSGAPAADAALQLAVFRVVQEAVTNVLRHGVGATHMTIDVESRGDETEVVVINDGPRVARGTDAGGRGLRGMRERAALYGGTVDAGPRETGGWRVHVVLRHPERTR